MASLAAYLGLLAIARPAAGDEPDAAKAQALFLEGRAALEKSDYPTACARFAASLALVSRPSTLINLAQCEQNRGQLVAASKHYQIGIAALPPGDERLPISKEHAAALERRLPHLTLALAENPPAGTKVEVDGQGYPLEDLRAGAPVDPGRHVVVLRVPGAAEQRATVDVVEGEAKTVAFAGAAPPPPPAEAHEGPSDKRVAGFVVGGVGVVGLVVAAGTGGVLVSKNAQITSGCPTKMGCSAAVQSLIDSTRPFQIVNAVGWGVGIAGVATGVVLVAIGGNAAKAPAAFAPAVLPGGGGVTATGRF